MRDLQGTSLQIPKLGNLVQEVELHSGLCLGAKKTPWYSRPNVHTLGLLFVYWVLMNNHTLSLNSYSSLEMIKNDCCEMTDITETVPINDGFLNKTHLQLVESLDSRNKVKFVNVTSKRRLPTLKMNKNMHKSPQQSRWRVTWIFTFATFSYYFKV